jgi:beta-glucanase (GH16 family)
MKFKTMNKLNILSLKKLMNISFSLLITLALYSCEDDSQTVVSFEQLVVQDEFDSDGALNGDIWNFDIGTGINGWGNNELQYYTNRPENIQVQNGFLIVTAREESYRGSNYTSAKILTKGKIEQTYGRFEARMKLPWGQGMWPAFWMLGADIDVNPWPGAGEIDIMEYRGQDPTIVLGSVHGPGYSGGEAVTKSYTLQNDRFDTGFHVFGIEWGPDFVNYYVDDVLYNQITPADVPGGWVFNKPFYLIINLAVGGTFVGSPNSETVFPQTMIIDYVRIYK